MKEKRVANMEFLRRRQARLRQNDSALKWLGSQGLDKKTIETFGLGLAEPYTDSKKMLHENALLAPVRQENGTFINQTIYINIPQITVNPENEVIWVKGSPQTYYADKYEGQAFLIVCDNIWDLWLTHQALRENKSASNLLLICPTPNSSEIFPEEWKKPEFWQRFESIYVGQQNSAQGEREAVRISQITGCETRRLRPPIHLGATWAEFWRAGGTVKEFLRLVSDAATVGAAFSESSGEDHSPGRFGYKPVDIGAAFHRGHLYYPVKTIVKSLDKVKDAAGNQITQLVSKKEVVVVRSDRTIHTVVEEPAPRGTPSENRILRLTDGTLIASHPKSPESSTWSWDSIDAYRQKRSKPRALKAILADIKNFLRGEVWLPYRYDYDLLTLLVPVTYAQAIFQSVPMILVTGEAGSGKSALGRAMCDVCANAVLIGQSSAASIARTIHDTKGFVVLDDLESIGNFSKKNTALFNDLVQCIKVSYKKETSKKSWTNVRSGMNVEELNFFGVKMINNTTGVDAILSSRMLKILTRKMPAELISLKQGDIFKNQPNTGSLQDELHTWTFENVALIDTTYQRIFPQPSDRAMEIAAPLRVFAEIAGDEDLAKGLETALSIKNETVEKPADPIDLMMRAVKNIVRDGYRQISTTHVTLEMKLINSRQSLDYSEPYQFKPEKWELPAWVGKHLRTYGFVEINAKETRSRLYGTSLRIYPVKDEFLKKINSENTSSQEYLKKEPLDFCRGDQSCSYCALNCPYMSSRHKLES
jgi:hypothetical protein